MQTIGSICGDIIGSVFEWHNVKREDFDLFSRESRFTDDTVMTVAMADKLLSCENLHGFRKNGDAATAYAARYRQYYSRQPHAGFGHMFLDWVKRGYNMNFSLDNIRSDYKFDSRTSYSVPPAISAFLESEDYESAIRKAISIGGDSDTIACIAGGIAHAFYKSIPKPIYEKCMILLDSGLKKTVNEFAALIKYN